MNNISEIQEGDSFESQPQSLDLEGDEDDTVQIGNVINHEGAEQQPAAFYNDLHIDKDAEGTADHLTAGLATGKQEKEKNIIALLCCIACIDDSLIDHMKTDERYSLVLSNFKLCLQMFPAKATSERLMSAMKVEFPGTEPNLWPAEVNQMAQEFLSKQGSKKHKVCRKCVTKYLRNGLSSGFMISSRRIVSF